MEDNFQFLHQPSYMLLSPKPTTQKRLLLSYFKVHSFQRAPSLTPSPTCRGRMNRYPGLHWGAPFFLSSKHTSLHFAFVLAVQQLGLDSWAGGGWVNEAIQALYSTHLRIMEAWEGWAPGQGLNSFPCRQKWGRGHPPFQFKQLNLT